jgi:hypothetical protein
MDEYDKKVLESGAKVLLLIQKSFGTSVSIEMLLQADVRNFLNNLVTKLWKRRRDVATFGIGVFAQLVENSISRLEKTPADRLPASTPSRLKAEKNSISRQGNDKPKFVIDTETTYAGTLSNAGNEWGTGSKIYDSSSSSSRLKLAQTLLAEATQQPLQ